MNTVRSVGYGWGVLIVAGGGAYYFAKKSINADRAAKAEAESQRRAYQRQIEASYYTSPPTTTKSSTSPSPASVPPSTQAPTSSQMPQSASSSTAKSTAMEVGNVRDKVRQEVNWHHSADDASSPAREASHDPAPTRHEPSTEGERVQEKSKYEASAPYRSRKGDRFS